MNKSARIIIIVLAIGLLFGSWWLYSARKKPPAPSARPMRVEKPSNEKLTNAPPAAQKMTNPPAGNPQQDEKMARVAKIKTAANVPIVFYGKIVNQFNQPVGGVRVEAAYNAWGLLDILNMRPERFTNVFHSDSAGAFVVKGIKGQSMDLKLEKKGFQLDPQSELTFGYGYPAPPRDVNPTNPVVYHVWERQGAANLVQQGFEKRVAADGTPISLNLETGRYEVGVTNSAGPTIKVWREPLFNDRRNTLPTNWQYQVAWPEGKLQFTDDIFCYLAPEKGYQEKLHREFHEGDPHYSYRDTQKFYFINKQGQFGAGSLEIWADYGGTDALVIFGAGWNPDGSRNLEPPE